VIQWIDVEGLENLPAGSYVVAANHAYRSGVDGFILGHLLATRASRVPRILITADSRNWVVRLERWVLPPLWSRAPDPDETATASTMACRISSRGTCGRATGTRFSSFRRAAPLPILRCN